MDDFILFYLFIYVFIYFFLQSVLGDVAVGGLYDVVYTVLESV